MVKQPVALKASDSKDTIDQGSVPVVGSLDQFVDRNYAGMYRYAFRLTGSIAMAEDLTRGLPVRSVELESVAICLGRTQLVVVDRAPSLPALASSKKSCGLGADQRRREFVDGQPVAALRRPMDQLRLGERSLGYTQSLFPHRADDVLL